MEIWKDIKGYEGKYQISNLGRVKSLKRKMYKRNCEEKILSLNLTGKGYYKIALCKNGKRKGVGVHRLVAQAFIPNPDNKPQVNHKNEIKTDNRVENLEWVDNNENLTYGKHNLRKYISLSIYYLKINMPNEKDLIYLLENFKNKIKK